MSKFSEDLKEAHYQWAQDMARTLDREPSEEELRSLGRVPFEHAAKWGYEYRKKEEKVVWHYSWNGTQSGKNFQQFKHLMASAIKMAPVTVRFTSPDIEKLRKALLL